ncbi:MAG: 50S ribosomal protein L18 [archaeon]
MKRDNIKPVLYRRKRAGKTDYHSRRRLLMSEKPRLVIRPSLKNIAVQFVVYATTGDRVSVGCSSLELKKKGWSAGGGNVPAAYLTGYLAGKKGIKADIKSAVLDVGRRATNKGSRICAALKGVLDAGVEVPCSKEIFPDEKRIRGEHIAAYKKAASGMQFSKSSGDNIKEFDDTKKLIEEK